MFAAVCAFNKWSWSIYLNKVKIKMTIRYVRDVDLNYFMGSKLIVHKILWDVQLGIKIIQFSYVLWCRFVWYQILPITSTHYYPVICINCVPICLDRQALKIIILYYRYVLGRKRTADSYIIFFPNPLTVTRHLYYASKIAKFCVF